MLQFLKRPGVVKALAVLVCAGLYFWKGIELDPLELLEVLGFGAAASQLVRRVGDKGPKSPPDLEWVP